MMISGTRLEAIVNTAAAHPEIRALYLFGSQASGSARPDSDFDLGVLYRNTQPLSSVLAFEEEIERILGTRVDVVTDLAITGKVAQFGRGVLVDVSSKLMGQFVENLERDVLATQSEGESVETPAEPAPEGATAELRRIDSKEPEAIDLLDMAGESAAKRLVPLGVGIFVLFVLWRILRSRR